MAAHDPDGVTMYPWSGREPRNFRPIARASFRFPELNAGWPQHVWERGTRTVAPNRSSTSTAAWQTPGEKAAGRQVKKRETGTDRSGSIPVVYGMRRSPRSASFRGRTPPREEGWFPRRSPGRTPRLQGFLAPVAGADPDHLLEVVDEDLPVADLAGPGGGQDPLDHRRHHFGVHYRLDLGLGVEGDHVFRPAVDLRVPLLAPEPLHLEDRHAGDAGLVQRLLHFLELERLDDRFDLLHGGLSPLDELEVGVGRVAVLVVIQAFHLLLLAHADPVADELRDEPEDDGEGEDGAGDQGDSRELGAELGHPPAQKKPGFGHRRGGTDGGICEEAQRDGPEPPLGPGDRGGAHRVVDPDPVEEKDRRDHQDAGEDADDG